MLGTVEITLLRIVADLLGFGIGLCLLRIYLAPFRLQLVSRVYGEDLHHELIIVSHAMSGLFSMGIGAGPALIIMR